MERLTGRVFRWGSGHFGFIELIPDKNNPVHEQYAKDGMYRVEAGWIQGERQVLVEGQIVRFTRHKGTIKNGVQLYQARDVTILTDDNDPEVSHGRTANPFQPGLAIVDPRRFAGRAALFARGTEAIQAGRNVLITGRSGIGKTSLANQLLAWSSGNNHLSQVFGQHAAGKMKSWTASFGGAGQSQVDLTYIANLLLGQLRSRVTPPKQQASPTFDFDGPAWTDVAEPVVFAQTVDRILKEGPLDVTGVTFHIDEVEHIGTGVALAPFIKVSSEQLRRMGRKVSFIVSGLLGTYDRLRAEHPSALNGFVSLRLLRMSPSETKKMVDLALHDSNVGCDPAAHELIHDLTNGYPLFVHSLGYTAFGVAHGNMIGRAEVETAADQIISTSTEFPRLFSRLQQEGLHDMLGALLKASKNYNIMDLGQIVARADKGNPAGVYERLRQLEALEVIDEASRPDQELKNKTFQFKDPLFRTYAAGQFNLKTR